MRYKFSDSLDSVLAFHLHDEKVDINIYLAFPFAGLKDG
jgi:hypothetical protein